MPCVYDRGTEMGLGRLTNAGEDLDRLDGLDKSGLRDSWIVRRKVSRSYHANDRLAN